MKNNAKRKKEWTERDCKVRENHEERITRGLIMCTSQYYINLGFKLLQVHQLT